MSLSVRYFLFEKDGTIRHIPKRVVPSRVRTSPFKRTRRRVGRLRLARCGTIKRPGALQKLTEGARPCRSCPTRPE